MSPRRSSRARTSQPSPLIPTQTNSSNSSVTSDRAQRATRSHNKLGSPQRSIPRSQSQDEADDSAKPPPRRTRSGQNEIKEPTPSIDLNGELEDDEAQEEDEITRCVCGQSEYPGLSTPLVELLQKAGYMPESDQTYEQLGDVFLCCDKCHVWQHAGCVGILGKINEPESYFCDECRRDLHKVSTSLEGQRFSRYAPVMDEPPYRRSPKPSTRNGKGKDRPRSNTDSTLQKRRITMNSRNEDEELARAIEESKRENGGTTPTAITRNGKRGREEDEERKSVTKRQRTDSSSPPHQPKEESTDEEATEVLADTTPKKSIRGAAARNHLAKEAREQKEKERQAAATARKARSERRRGEDSDHEEQVHDHPPSTAASSPPPEPTPVSVRIAGKKKPTPARRGRVGRNQHNRERDSPGLETAEEPTNLLTTNPHNTRARSRSRSLVRGDDASEKRAGASAVNGTVPEARAGNSTNGGRPSAYDDGGLLSKPSKAKNFNEKKTSMNEMKKRVAAILEFVHRAQTERTVAEGSGSSTGMSRSTSGAGGGQTINVTTPPTGSGTTRPSVPAVTVDEKEVASENGTDHKASRETFDQLSAAEMLVSLRSRLVAFEGSYGRWGDSR